MKPLIFELVSEGTWKAETPFGVNYYVLDHGSEASMLAPDGIKTFCHDIYEAMEAVRADFEERTLECLGASEALRRTNDTIRKAERITRANPSLANLFEDLLQLARVREASTAPAPVGEPVTLTYTNYRGETSVRRIKPMALYYGRSEWHEGWQWILRARDLDKDAVREFALKDFGVPATARNDALEEAAKIAQTAWVSADYDTVGIADADMAMRLCEHTAAAIRSLKSETKP